MRIRHLLVAAHRARAAAALTAAFAGVSVIAASPAAASASAGWSHEAEAHTVDITGVDFSFRIDTHGGAEAGLVDVRFHNRGRNDHQAQLFRLNDGVTPDRFKADLQSGNPGSIFADSVPTGGAGIVHPRDDQQVWDALQGGTYAVVSFVAGSDGVPDLAKGMLGFFPLEGVVSPAKLAALRPHQTVQPQVITAHDLTYTMPRVLLRNRIYRFEDTDGKDVHEIDLGRLMPGKTVDDAKAYFVRLAQPGDPGPAPFRSEGGHGAVLPGGHGWFRVDDDPGRYVAFCLVPDDQTGLPHAAMGMVVGFDVR
jgi:hypothetical protein